MRLLEKLRPQAKMYKLAKQIETNAQFMLLLGDKPGSVKTGYEPRAVPTRR